jgi:hypothetical protein
MAQGEALIMDSTGGFPIEIDSAPNVARSDSVP